MIDIAKDPNLPMPKTPDYESRLNRRLGELFRRLGQRLSSSGSTIGELQAFSDNAAAKAGGLQVGDLYHTAGILKVVL